MSKYEALIVKLREIIQIDRAELDFGIFRILNARSEEIDKYLTSRLKELVEESLRANTELELSMQRRKLNKIGEYVARAGCKTEDSPVYVEISEEISRIENRISLREEKTYSHLLTFFSRYYDNGDIVVRRRYRGDAYAVPYSGEETFFHWVNRDQYYVKTDEKFTNFRFRLDDGRTVYFKLVNADNSNTNRLDATQNRIFELATNVKIPSTDDLQENKMQFYEPIEEFGEELVIRFCHIPLEKGVTQKKLTQDCLKFILNQDTIKSNWSELSKIIPTASNPYRTKLEKFLTEYTQKNKSDYFIHKDLKRFLNSELDTYIKNEVVDFDNMDEELFYEDIEDDITMIRSFREIARKIIDFLAEIEEFKKKLWLKRKFVVSSEYNFTLDLIPETLYEEVSRNAAQWKQWRELGLVDAQDTGNVSILKENPGLMVDTELYDAEFRANLMASFDDLDSILDGVLVKGDNFQALNLLKSKYKNKVDFIYIDPPYNTANSKIAYKNQFEHSSWLSLISNTLSLSNEFLGQTYSFGFAIDDHEYGNALMLLKQHFVDCDISTIVINHHPQGAGGRVSRTHEYFIVASPPDSGNYQGRPKPDEIELKHFMASGIAENNYRTSSSGGGRWRNFYALLVDPESGKVVSAEPPPEPGIEYQEGPTDSGLLRIYPINSTSEERVWLSSYEKGKERAESGELIYTKNGTIKQRISHMYKREVISSNWVGPEFNAGAQGTAVLSKLGLGDQFNYPKSIKTLEQTFWMQSFGKPDFMVMDYFAGSGSTAHAVISLNRQYGGKRKYILVEKNDYFDSVLVPRIKKIVFTDEWKDGKPVSARNDISHAFQVLKIESYEDTLNNLELQRTKEQEQLLHKLSPEFHDEFLVHYMLDTESRNSLLSLEVFRKPFDYIQKIAEDSTGVWENKNINLVETFNFLIGLSVQKMELQVDQGYVLVHGKIAGGKKVLIVWRDCDAIDNSDLRRKFKQWSIASREIDLIYINGDHDIPSKYGEVTTKRHSAKLLDFKQIEIEFFNKMFDWEIR